ncbi:MAG: Preprotein translocase, SecE subunit [Parcubacteria group bacterium GW2011_GWA2_47_12]|nr:MAG: Preprotein translocase, SecE subunit [Parcubacteria group bacterium GW2011_GWA2_47_12]
MSRITEYLKETRGELRHVNWPTRKQAAVFTALVVAVSLITAAYLGVFDYIFSRLLQLVI